MEEPQGKHGVPALFSLICPGLGQLVKKQIGKAFKIWGGFVVCAIWGSVFLLGGPPVMETVGNFPFFLSTFVGTNGFPDGVMMFCRVCWLLWQPLVGLLALPAALILWVWQIMDAYND